MQKNQYVRRIVGAIILIGAGLSPFMFYIGLKLTEPAAQPTWPSGIAVATGERDELQSLALIHFLDGRPMIVRFPIETSLNVPAAGTLRARTAYGIGRTAMLARALQETLGVAVPYWAEWRSGATAGRPPDATNLGTHVQDAMAIIARTDVRVVTAPGRVEQRANLQYYILDLRQLALILRGLAPSATPTPTPTPSPSPSASEQAVSVEVLNQGGEAGAATDIATRLQQAGYLEIRAGNSTRRAINGITVYYAADRTAALRVAQIIGPSVTAVAPLPDGIDTTADILVLVGRTATATPRPRTTPPRSSPTPSPSGSDVVVP